MKLCGLLQNHRGQGNKNFLMLTGRENKGVVLIPENQQALINLSRAAVGQPCGIIGTAKTEDGFPFLEVHGVVQ